MLSPSPKTQSVSSRDDKRSKEEHRIGALFPETPTGEEIHDWRAFEDDCNDLPLEDILRINNMKRAEGYCSSESDSGEPQKPSSKQLEKRNPLC